MSKHPLTPTEEESKKRRRFTFPAKQEEEEEGGETTEEEEENIDDKRLYALDEINKGFKQDLCTTYDFLDLGEKFNQTGARYLWSPRFGCRFPGVEPITLSRSQGNEGLACCVNPDYKYPIPGTFWGAILSIVSQYARIIEYIWRNGDSFTKGEADNWVYEYMGRQLNPAFGFRGHFKSIDFENKENLERDLKRADANPGAISVILALTDDTLKLIKEMITERIRLKNIQTPRGAGASARTGTERYKLFQLFDRQTAPLIRSALKDLTLITRTVGRWQPHRY